MPSSRRDLTDAQWELLDSLIPCTVCWRLWLKTFAAVVDSICKKPSSTVLSLLQKRGHRRGQTKRGKEATIMAVADRHGLPVTVYTESATPNEVKLVLQTLAENLCRRAYPALDW
jgi:hypothetical protein